MKQKKNWFYRMLFSYLPILLVISSILIVSFFFFIIKLSQREAKSINEFQVHVVMQSVDRVLQAIDSTVMQDIQQDKVFSGFFSGGGSGNEKFLNYEVGQKLAGWQNAHPAINSAYVVRKSDGLVISTTSLDKLGDFADREFIRQVEEMTASYPNWTNARQDPLSSGGTIASLIRQVPLLTGDQGMVVVNVRTDKVLQMIKENDGLQYSYLTIMGNDGLPILNSDAAMTTKQADGSDWRHAVVKSSYTGWMFTSGVKQKYGLAFASFFSYVWIIVALLVTILGSIWMIYITHRNYQPIKAIMSRMHAHHVKKSAFRQNKQGEDEFSFIGSTLEDLVDELEEFERQSERDAGIKKKHILYELMDGMKSDKKLLNEELRGMNLPLLTDRFIVTIAEIDRFHLFHSTYSAKDQNLFRYIIMKVSQEIAERYPFHVWCEWLTGNRLTALILLDKAETDDWSPSAARFWREVSEWIDLYLDFTVTIGIGTEAASVQDIQESYRSAKEVLRYKWLLEHTRVLRQDDLGLKKGKHYFESHHLVNSLVHSYRVGDGNWQNWYDKMFEDVKKSVLARDDMVELLNYLLFNLDKELSLLALDSVDWMKEDALSHMREEIGKMESITVLQDNLRRILEKLAEHIRKFRESSKNHKLIEEVKAYIEHHYDDPNLSLTSISDRFGMSGTYVSKLFKEKFGETFVDYLIGVRIDKAKQELTGTSESIQAIALRVGYTHTVSFNRAFKKLVGRTPGEYRLQKEGSSSMGGSAEKYGL